MQKNQLLTRFGQSHLQIVTSGLETEPLVFTVHGINGSPTDLDDIHVVQLARNRTLYTYLYPDEPGDLDDEAETLATSLLHVLKQRPADQPFEVYAHSLGGRIAVRALNLLAGHLGTRPGRLVLIAPMLGGISNATYAYLVPGFIKGIDRVNLGKDMSPSGAFQRRLRAPRPTHLHVEVYRGDADEALEINSAYRSVLRALGAQETVVPGADHMSVIREVAQKYLGPEPSASP